MLRVGMVGIGFMGWIHYLAYQQVRGVRVEAICSRDPKKLRGDWRGIRGNFGPPGEKVDVSQTRVYADFGDLLADDQIDLVDICLPPALHAEATLAALKAGKHVFCEKPMALNAADCQKMVHAAEKADRLLFVGHVLPMFPEYAFAHQAALKGTFGPVLGGYFKRIVSDPRWLSGYYDPQRVGGPLLDLHVHDAHFIRVLFGMPDAVTCSGRTRGEVVEFCHTLFHYPDEGLAVAATSGVINQQGRAFTHSFEIHFHGATLQFDSAVIDKKPVVLLPLTVFKADGRVQRPKLSDGDPVRAFVAEIEEIKRCVKAHQPSPVLGAGLAEDAIQLCHRQTQAVLKGRTTKM